MAPIKTEKIDPYYFWINTKTGTQHAPISRSELIDFEGSIFESNVSIDESGLTIGHQYVTDKGTFILALRKPLPEELLHPTIREKRKKEIEFESRVRAYAQTNPTERVYDTLCEKKVERPLSGAEVRLHIRAQMADEAWMATKPAKVLCWVFSIILAPWLAIWLAGLGYAHLGLLGGALGVGIGVLLGVIAGMSLALYTPPMLFIGVIGVGIWLLYKLAVALYHCRPF